MFLLDTNIVSELRKTKPHGGVLAWIAAIPERELFLSALTLGELQAGVELTRRQDTEKAAAIEAWIGKVEQDYQVIPLDAAVLREWARLMHRRSDHLIEDAMIAATARVYKLTVATRNIRDFAALDVQLVDPFTYHS
jgi:predicted nucleic acid-binding protein